MGWLALILLIALCLGLLWWLGIRGGMFKGAAAALLLGQLMKLMIDEWQQPIERLLISRSQLEQELAHSIVLSVELATVARR